MKIIPNTKRNRDNCICPKCPSYPKNCDSEVLYCGKCASKQDININGCICSACKVYKENKLDRFYYCTKNKLENSIEMRKKYINECDSTYKNIINIKKIAANNESVITSMGSLKKMPFNLNDLHFIPAQVDIIPLNKEDKVNSKTIIGPNAKRPLILSSPILISGMSFGAVSKNVRLVISRVASNIKIGFNSGEGGILENELENACKYMIGQYSTARYGLNEKNIKKVAAIEIRFGQGAYPGKGSYLPSSKITNEVRTTRGLKEGDDAYSPAHHDDMTNPTEIRNKINWLRKITNGVPIGAKIGCGNIEKDVEILVKSGVDFIAIDGFGGGTGATDLVVRENVGIPLIAALPRASRTLLKLKVKNKVSLIVGGGLRDSADFGKCLALGANAVYIGTAALIAINCQQYRVCSSGKCPTGVTTHIDELVNQIEIDKATERLEKFISIETHEIENFARIIGKNDISKLDKNDLISLKKEVSEITGTKWLDNNNYK